MPRLAVLVILAFGLSAAASQAASIRVAPVGFELTGGTATSTLQIRNEDQRPVTVQVRVFRWNERGGPEALEPTRDVVASPPLATLAPGTENLVRIVRLKKGPAGPRETYRLLVDEVPDRRPLASGQIQVVVRHSIPVVFSD